MSSSRSHPDRRFHDPLSGLPGGDPLAPPTDSNQPAGRPDSAPPDGSRYQAPPQYIAPAQYTAPPAYEASPVPVRPGDAPRESGLPERGPSDRGSAESGPAQSGSAGSGSFEAAPHGSGRTVPPPPAMYSPAETDARPQPMRSPGDAGQVPDIPVPRRTTRGWMPLVVVAGLAVLLFGGVGYGFTVSGGDVDLGDEPLTAATFYDDDHWIVKVNDNEAHAEKVGAWDHADCSDAGDAQVMTILAEAGCEYGIEAIYQRTDLELTVYQRVFVLADAPAAEAAVTAVEDGDLSTAFTFRQELPEEAQYGDKVGSSQRYLVVTLGVLTGEAAKAAAEYTEGDPGGNPHEEAGRTYLYFHTEKQNVLLWR